MEKYGTYEVYENKLTGEIIRVPLHSELIKLGSDEFKKLETDPNEEENGTTIHKLR